MIITFPCWVCIVDNNQCNFIINFYIFMERKREVYCRIFYIHCIYIFAIMIKIIKNIFIKSINIASSWGKTDNKLMKYNNWYKYKCQL